MKTPFDREYKVVSSLEVAGKPFLLVELNHAMYVDGLLTKLILVNPSQFERSAEIQNKVEVVDD